MSPRGRDLVWETYVVTNRSLASTVESKTVQARGTFTFQYFKEIPCILKLTTHITLFPILISFSLLKIKFCHFVNAVQSNKLFCLTAKVFVLNTAHKTESENLNLVEMKTHMWVFLKVGEVTKTS